MEHPELPRISIRPMSDDAQFYRKFHLSDLLLGISAALSIIMFLLWMPDMHPDALLQEMITEDRAVERSRAFLRRHQVAVGDRTPVAQLRRNMPLLGGLQRRLGRADAVAFLKEGGNERLPVHYWEVTWLPDGPEEADPAEISTLVTASGRVFSFSSRWIAEATLQPDTEALTGAALSRRDDRMVPAESPDSQDQGFGRDRPPPVSARDSVFAAADSVFAALQQKTGRDVRLIRRRRGRDAARGGGRFELDTLAVTALARYHLDQSTDLGTIVSADSVWMPIDKPGIIRTRFTTQKPVHGIAILSVVETTPLGVLAGMETSFDHSRNATPAWWRRSEFADTVSIVLLIVLVIAMIIAFFRRLGANSVDVKAAMRDGVVMGSFGFLSMLLRIAASLMSEEVPAQGVVAFAGSLLASAFIGLGIGLLVFFVAGAADSMSREIGDERNRSLGFVRSTHFFARPVGSSILRGIGLGLVFAGLCVLGLRVFPDAWLIGRPEAQMGRIMISPFLAILASNVWGGYLSLAIALTGIVSFLRARDLSRIWVILLGVLVLGLLRMAPVRFGGSLAAGAGALFSGAYLLWIYWRYDFLAAFIALIVGATAFTTGLSFWDASGVTADGGIALGLMAVMVFGGVYVSVRGRPTDEVPEYVPSYIRELAAKERLTRELEIARQVQESFLPRRMPEMEGVEALGYCLPANEVGGDYYDFVKLSDSRIAVIVGDVSGKGIQAAFYMTLSKAFFRTLCREIDATSEVLKRMNRLFWENAERGTFISVVYGILDLDKQTFTFSRAGHNPVFLKRSPSQVPDMVRPGGIALGLDSGERFDSSIEEVTLRVKSGDALVLYTDGFSEAVSAANERYGDERLAARIGALGSLSAEEILNGITEDVDRFIDGAGRQDDMTIVVIKLTPSAGGYSLPGS